MPRTPLVSSAPRRRGARVLRAGLAGVALACLVAGAPADAALPPPVSWSAAQQRASGLRIEHLRPGAYRRTHGAPAYLGLAPARDGLMPGLRVAAVAESGRPLQALWVPASAVLFHGGRAFVFVASKPAPGGDRQFTARIASTAWPLGDGYVQPGWTALDVVVGGAGLLLTPPPEAHTLPPAGATDERDAG